MLRIKPGLKSHKTNNCVKFASASNKPGSILVMALSERTLKNIISDVARSWLGITKFNGIQYVQVSQAVKCTTFNRWHIIEQYRSARCNNIQWMNCGNIEKFWQNFQVGYPDKRIWCKSCQGVVREIPDKNSIIQHIVEAQTSRVQREQAFKTTKHAGRDCGYLIRTQVPTRTTLVNNERK